MHLLISAKLACCGGYYISIQKIMAEVPLHINFGVVVRGRLTGVAD